MNGLDVFKYRHIHGSLHRTAQEYNKFIKEKKWYMVPEATHLVLIQEGGRADYECLICDTFLTNDETEMQVHLVETHSTFACGFCSKIDFNVVACCKEQHQREMDKLANNMEISMEVAEGSNMYTTEMNQDEDSTGETQKIIDMTTEKKEVEDDGETIKVDADGTVLCLLKEDPTSRDFGKPRERKINFWVDQRLIEEAKKYKK